MLQQMCETLHNYFIRDTVSGNYEIAGGMISPMPFLKEGQRFLIAGSDLNDGVYTYHEYGLRDDDDSERVGLHDEAFTGAVCVMAVPPAAVALSGEIKAWVDKYGEVTNSPYQSENVVGVYSYTRATGTNGGTATWQSVFGDRLKAWRKVAFS